MHRIIFTNNTRLNDNVYTKGSGVGAVSALNRAALKRSLSKNKCCDTTTSRSRQYFSFVQKEPAE